MILLMDIDNFYIMKNKILQIIYAITLLAFSYGLSAGTQTITFGSATEDNTIYPSLNINATTSTIGSTISFDAVHTYQSATNDASITDITVVVNYNSSELSLTDSGVSLIYSANLIGTPSIADDLSNTDNDDTTNKVFQVTYRADTGIYNCNDGSTGEHSITQELVASTTTIAQVVEDYGYCEDSTVTSATVAQSSLPIPTIVDLVNFKFTWNSTATSVSYVKALIKSTGVSGDYTSGATSILRVKVPSFTATTATLTNNIPANTVAGNNASFTITIRDINGNPTDATSSLSFAGTAAGFFTIAEATTQGSVTINYQTTVAGTYTIAIYVGNTLAVSTQTITIQTADFANILLTASPINIIEASTVSIVLVATLRDSFNNTITSDNSSTAIFKTSSTTIFAFDTNGLESTIRNITNGIATLAFTASNTSIGMAVITAYVGGIGGTVTITVSSGFDLDIDGSGGNLDISTDGILIIRFMGGQSSIDTTGAVASDRSRDDAEILSYLQNNVDKLDIDGSGGNLDISTDGILIIRFMGGQSSIDTTGAVASDRSRNDAQILQYLQSLVNE